MVVVRRRSSCIWKRENESERERETITSKSQNRNLSPTKQVYKTDDEGVTVYSRRTWFYIIYVTLYVIKIGLFILLNFNLDTNQSPTKKNKTQKDKARIHSRNIRGRLRSK